MGPSAALEGLARRVGELSPEKRSLLARRNPLSFAQERLWFLDRLHGGSGFYNGALAIELRGRLRAAALAAALGEIVRRHQILRTIFLEVDGLPFQMVAPAAPVALPLIDLTSLAEGRAERLGEGLALEIADRPFDLAVAPLLRAALLRRAARRHVLVLALHHIAVDRWSSLVLLRELAALYGAYAQGSPSPLPEPSLQYADFSAWQRGEARDERQEAELGYWRGRLEGAPALLELPFDRPRPALESFRGGRARHPLPLALGRALRAFAQRLRATEFMVLLAAFATLLHRLGGGYDLLIGTSVDHRDRVELEGLIGLFLNTLVLRARMAGDPDVEELLAQTRQTVLEAQEHRNLPFERLVEALRPERALSHNPLFQVELNLLQAPSGRLEMPELETAVRAVDRGTAIYDLVLVFEQSGEELAAFLDFNADLFDRTSALRLLDQLERLLAGMLEEPGRRISTLPLLSPPARHQLLVEWSSAGFALRRPAASVQELFAAQAASRPTALAATCGERRIAYGELDRSANRLAHWLRAAGAGRERRVAVLGERGIDLLTAVLGIAKAGAAYVPLEPGNPDRRLTSILEDCAPALLVTQGSMAERAIGLAASLPAPPRVLCWDDPPAGLDLPGSLSLAAQPEGDPACLTAGHDLANMFYTSGSTGRPKGAMIEHAGMLNHLWGKVELLALSPDSVVAQNASQGFDISVWQLLAPLLVGGRVAIYDEAAVNQPETFLARIERDGVTVLETVPTLLELMLSGVAAEVRLPRLEYLISNAETLPVPLSRRWSERFPATPLINTYGATECSDDVTHQIFRRPLPELAQRVGVGRPIAGMEVYVLDRELGPLPAGCPGQIGFTGVGVGRGYLGDPVKTAQAFLPDPFATRAGGRLYRTGDLGRWTPAGGLEFLGRIDHQVKVRGFRIELGEVEAALAGHPAVREAVVVVRRDGPGDEKLAAYAVCERGAEPPADELRAFLRGRLPEPMVPSAFVFLAALPLTPNGKVDRRALPAPEVAQPSPVAPRGPVEEMVAAIWSEVLRTESVGARDDFFALGGHSLLATRVLSRVRSTFGIEVPLRLLFEKSVLEDLAAAIDRALGAGAAAAAPPIRPLPRSEPPPLSFAQQRLWILDQLEPASPAYNLPLALRYRGRLDRAALAASLSEVARRHEVLRTTFRPGEDGPVQSIAPPSPVPLPLLDLAGLPGERREAESRRSLAAEALRPFDLRQGPLLRALLIRRGDEEHALLVTLHHAVADGWSMDLFRWELERLYGSLRRGEASPLPAPPIQYADFAVWQREWLAGDRLASEVAYWRRQLAGAPPLLDLPADRPRPAVRSPRGGARFFGLAPSLSDGLRTFSRQRSATLFMTLLAGFQALLARYAGQADVVIGTPVAGRTRLEVEGLIGFFVNTLALRSSLAGDPGLAGLIARVREVALGAYAHQDLPFERLVEELAPERSLAYSPLFQVLFALENTPRRPAGEATGLESSELEIDGAAAKFDLILALAEGEGTIAGGVTYSLDLFDGVTVERLGGHLASLLAAALAEPERRLSTLPLLTAAESQQLREWDDEPEVGEAAGCLHELFAAQVRRAPEGVAVVDGAESLRYGELDERANRLANWLRAEGVGPEARVGVCLDRSLDLVVALLAVLKAGGAYVPLDPTYPRERLAFILDDSGVAVALSREGLRGALPAASAGGGLRVVLLEDLHAALAAAPAEAPAGGALAENLAYLIYTSGSTGRPKAVAIRHRSAAALIRWARQVYSDADLAGVLASTSVCFDLSVFELFVPLSHGGRVILARNALELPRLPAAASVTLINTVPSAMAELVWMQALPPSLRVVNLAGEPLPRSLVEQIRRSAPAARVLNLYGPSEDTTYSTFTVVPEGATPTIGRPLPGTRAHVLGPHLAPCPVGVPGELHLAGGGLARGYLGRPELTAASFLPDPFSAEPGGRLYRTGDLARLRPDRELEFLGRLDQQVKIRGFRIEPGEIEAVLAGHPAVREAAVVPGPGELAERGLIAYLVPSGAGLEVSEVRRFLADRLPGFLVPSAYVVLPELPLTANGKVDRRALPDPEPGGTGRGEPAAPRTAVEEILAGLWRQVLKVAAVGRRDSFFEIGGHSLLATRLVSRLRETFGVELPLRRLFEEPTLAGLARTLEATLAGRQGALPAPPLERLPQPRRPPLSFAQQRLWFLEQLAPGSPAYTLSGAVRLLGDLEVAVLARCFAEVVRRHEVLRARFSEVEGRPVQAIAPLWEPGLPVVDLAGLPQPEREELLRRLAADEAARPFDLGRGPLLRLGLLRLGPGEHVLVIALHHIVADAWSLQVLLGELRSLYPNVAAGRPSPLAELPIQYGDFAAWQRSWLGGEVLESLLGYWRRKLAGLRPLLLPTDHPRTAAASRGRSRRFRLDGELTEGVRELGRREGTTLFMTLLAGFEVVLHGLSGEDDIVVGADIANRTRGETEGLIGFFINMLALRSDLSRNPGFRQLLGRLRETALGAYAHQDLPFDRLVEELQPDRSAGHSPLFSVVFNFNNTQGGDGAEGLGRLGPLELEPIAVEPATVRFELALLMRQVPSGLEALWLFDGALFAAASIEGMQRRFEAVLRAVVADPDARLSRLAGLGGDDRRQDEAREREADRRRKLWQVRRAPVKVEEPGGGAVSE